MKCIVPFTILFFFFRPSFASYEPVITSISIDQGLSNNTVRCIFQDHKGFMWFGTHDGLSLYDGYTFRVFRNKINDSNSLSNNMIYALNEDHGGNIWIGHRNGVSIFHPLTDRFTQLSFFSVKGIPRQLSDVVRTIKTDKKNNVFIGAENLGLLFCKNGDSLARQIPLFHSGTKTMEFGVQVVKVAADNKVWVFVQNKGLCLLDYASMHLQLVNSTVQSALSMEMDGNDILICTPNGIFRYNIFSDSCAKDVDLHDGLQSSDLVIAITLDKNRNLWMGINGGGVKVWNRSSGRTERFQVGDSKYSLTSGTVYAIYEDKQSRIWLGTFKGGINMIDQTRKRFGIVAREPGSGTGFNGNFVSSFFETPDGNLWIGTEDGGLNFWNRKKNTFTNYRYNSQDPNSLFSNNLTSISGDDQSLVWIATFSKGIARFQPSGNSFKRYICVNPATGIENKIVFMLYRDRSKTLWATTLRQGNHYGALYYYSEFNDRFEAFDTRLSDLFALYEDRQGNFWGGDLSHLIKIDRTGKKHAFYIIGHSVRTIHEDKSGNFWIGTEGGGLILFDREKKNILTRFTTADGLCNNSILNILEDAQGSLWMSTLNGLSKFNPSDRTFINYYKSDGLQSNQFNYNAALALRSGELVFGGIYGFSLFHPEQIGRGSHVPDLLLTSINVNGTPISFDHPFVVERTADEMKKLKVPYNQAVFSFDFTALEYTAPDKISYAYYLEGWDRNWNYAGNLRTANYTHLKEGTYILRVKSTDSEGTWNPKEITLTIVVLPPWYRTWWAYTLYILVAVAFIFLYQRYRAYRTKLKYEVKIAELNAENERAERERSQAELEKEKAERETERVKSEKEREINEKKLDFFTNVSHEFRTPLTLIINPIKDLLKKRKENNTEPEGELHTVYRNARRLLSQVDQLLHFKKAENIADKFRPVKLNVCGLCKEVYLCFVHQARSKNITYEFECGPESLEIYADPQKLEIILYNLISNALKYTGHRGKIMVRISEMNDIVEIIVEDNGAGIPKEAGERLFEKFYQPERKGVPAKPGFGIGLYLVKHLTEEHKGTISYESEEGKGTTFTLKLRKGKDHFGPEEAKQEDTAQSMYLQELNDETDAAEATALQEEKPVEELVTGKQVILVVDNDEQILKYLAQLFQAKYVVHQAETGELGLQMARKYLPDLVISDVNMAGINGIVLCRAIKEDPALNHIPVILLTASSSAEVKLQGVEGGADDYITKPFDNDILLARVNNLLKSRNTLQQYFYSEITLNRSYQKISQEYKEFIEKCILIVENHLDDENFGVKALSSEMGMSHSNLFRRVKSVSGQSINVFIRFIRLRKAAELLIHTNLNVGETAFQVGINNVQYFREQFSKLFGMNPSEYIKKYRKPFSSKFTVNKDLIDRNKGLEDNTSY